MPLRLDLFPDTTPEDWRRRLDDWRQTAGRRSVRALVATHLPARLAEEVCRLCGVSREGTASQLGAKSARALCEALAGPSRSSRGGLPLTAIGSGGFESAMVTRGGVSLDEVDGRTLQSRLVKGLFLAGEVLDVDGPSGGFNLQWAFSSGRLAGLSATG